MAYSVNTKPLLEDYEQSSDSEEYCNNVINPDCCDAVPECQVPRGSVPKDWYKAGFFTFYLLGIVTMLPYTFFVTANDYWMYKLRDVSVNNSAPENKTTLQAEFTSYITIAAAGPTVFVMIINSLYSHRISVQFRMLGSQTTILILFILTTVLVEINTDASQFIFFTVTLATVVIINAMGAILQAGLLGIACKFSSRYMTAVVSGQALGGIFPALVYIVCLSVGVSSTHSALLYFNIANLCLIISLLSYFALSQSLFFRYHTMVGAPANTLQYDPMEVSNGETQNISIGQVFSKIWVYGLTGMTCYVITVSVYPGVTVLISSLGEQSAWTDKYFVPVVSFLVFGVWDYIGRNVAGFLKWPLKRPRIILLLASLRVCLVPLLLLCNVQPRHNLPVLIPYDSIYVVITCVLAFSNGYITNIMLINVPKAVDGVEQEMASSIVTTFIAIGCALGALLSFVFLRII